MGCMDFVISYMIIKKDGGDGGWKMSLVSMGSVYEFNLKEGVSSMHNFAFQLPIPILGLFRECVDSLHVQISDPNHPGVLVPHLSG